TVTFQPQNGGGNADLFFKLYTSGTVSVANGAAMALAVSISDFDATHTGGITKTGGGTATLSGSNTFSGATTLSANGGKLNAGATGALGATSSITVHSGGTLLFGG